MGKTVGNDRARRVDATIDRPRARTGGGVGQDVAMRTSRSHLLAVVSLAVSALLLSSCGSSSTTTSTAAGGSACPAADGSAPAKTTFDAAPPMCIDVKKTYVATFDTTLGTFKVKLDPKSAPLAANNFVFLARNHFYDGVAFHRIIPSFVIQGGDATGQPAGTGGPGYEFKDELPADATVYGKGSFAMANAGPNSNGSQFFVVLEPGKLQALYSYFGEVTEGFDTTVQAIAKTGTPSGKPSSVTTMKTVTITES